MHIIQGDRTEYHEYKKGFETTAKTTGEVVHSEAGQKLQKLSDSFLLRKDSAERKQKYKAYVVLVGSSLTGDSNFKYLVRVLGVSLEDLARRYVQAQALSCYA